MATRRKQTKPERRRVVAYCRVSTVEQASEGASLDAQETKLRAYCEAMADELELVDLIRDEGASAKTLDRPGLSRVLAMLDEGTADAVLVTKLDRLTRSVRDLGELIERYFATDGAASLLSLSESVDTQTAGGRLVLNIMASISQWEREAIGERTKEVLAHKRAQGERVGSVPYGKRLAADGIALVDDPAELRAIRLARRLRAQGKGFRAIGRELDAKGHKPRGGVRWHHQTVANVLRAQT